MWKRERKRGERDQQGGATRRLETTARECNAASPNPHTLTHTFFVSHTFTHTHAYIHTHTHTRTHSDRQTEWCCWRGRDPRKRHPSLAAEERLRHRHRHRPPPPSPRPLPIPPLTRPGRSAHISSPRFLAVAVASPFVGLPRLRGGIACCLRSAVSFNCLSVGLVVAKGRHQFSTTTAFCWRPTSTCLSGSLPSWFYSFMHRPSVSGECLRCFGSFSWAMTVVRLFIGIAEVW
uniref:Uncharacterized protein n=1 Tax=Physcomitrium patens TaxID=3218 RepID=A0A7I3ZBL6_PHYPA